MPRRLHSAVVVLALSLGGASWWFLPRPTPAAPQPAPVVPPPPAAPFGVWRGAYTMAPAGLWEEAGILEMQVTRQLVEATPVARAYQVEARLRSSRYGLLTAAGALRQETAHPERGWVLAPLRSDTPGVPVLQVGKLASWQVAGVPSPPANLKPGNLPTCNLERPNSSVPTFPSPHFEIVPLPGAGWNVTTPSPRFLVRTWHGVPDGAPRCGLEGEVTLERRTELLTCPVAARQVEVRVERPEMPPSDLRHAIENLAAPGTPEAAEPLPPWAEETALRVRVRNAAGKPVAGERVRVRISPEEEGGGHVGVHSGPRPHGWLLAETATPARLGGPRTGSLEPEWLGTTDAAGEIRLRYRAPEVAGVETLSAELAHQPEIRAFIELRVGLPLVALPPNPDYFLVGGTFAHPSADGDAGTSHFVAAAVLPKLAAVAAEFRLATGLPLRVNDSSLPWGGLFDIDGRWERPHYNHRDGTDVDLAVFGYGGTGPPPGRSSGALPDTFFPASPEPRISGTRALSLAEIDRLASAVRRQGGRPGFEGDHVHASFGSIRFAEGPPRPPASDGELVPALKALLDGLEMLPDEPTTPAAPAGKGSPGGTGRGPAAGPPPSHPEPSPTKPPPAAAPAPSVKPAAQPAAPAAPEPAPPTNKPPDSPRAPDNAPAANPPAPAKPPAFDPTAPLTSPAGAPPGEKPPPSKGEGAK